MTQKKLTLLLVDFDGVMSKGKFYDATDEAQKELGAQAVRFIFTAENIDLLNDWMRGDLSYKALHDDLEKKTGLPARQLDRLLEDSVKRMSLNEPLLRFVASLRKKGVVVSLFTNNMDIFDMVSREHHKLDDYFDHIYSSSAHGQLKLENDALLLRAIREAGTDKVHTAFVDDSTSSHQAATNYGIATFLYEHYVDSQEDFEAWLRKEYTF